MMTPEQIRQLERASLDGLPALREDLHDGWLLRQADGYSRRANCVMPLGPCERSLPEKMDHAEAAYAASGLPCVLKLTAASEPVQLDDALSGRGYRRDAETLVLIRALTDDVAPEPSTDGEILLHTRPDSLWLNTWAQLSPRTSQLDILRQLLGMIRVPAVFAVIRVDGTPVGCARAAVSGEWVGLFDLAVHPDHRGRGYGRALAEARLAWAYAEGARSAYLQVMANNVEAQRLQARLGFGPAYHYWYRLQ